MSDKHDEKARGIVDVCLDDWGCPSELSSMMRESVAQALRDARREAVTEAAQIVAEDHGANDSSVHRIRRLAEDIQERGGVCTTDGVAEGVERVSPIPRIDAPEANRPAPTHENGSLRAAFVEDFIRDRMQHDKSKGQAESSLDSSTGKIAWRFYAKGYGLAAERQSDERE